MLAPQRSRLRLATAVLTATAALLPVSAGSTGTDTAPHARLMALTGRWEVHVGGEPAGSAQAVSRLGGRFLEVSVQADTGPVRSAIYTFGFDARHSVYTVIAMDESGSYWVTGSGSAEDGSIEMVGTDDDPAMSAMGLEKKFVIVLRIDSEDRVRIETRLIDTRTPEEREIPFVVFDLTRTAAPDRAAAAADVRAAEQAFAQTMADRDLAAFSEFLAEEAVFFGQATLRGREAVRQGWSPYFRGESAPFSWAPEVVEVLASGELALSSGPVFDPAGERVGTFQSTWRLEPDGRWRVVFDKGCPPCPRGEKGAALSPAAAE